MLLRRTKSSQKRGVLSKERITNPFIYKMTPIYMGGNNENDRVASPESVLIHLKCSLTRLQLFGSAASESGLEFDENTDVSKV